MRNLLPILLTATTGAIAGWWWQNRARQLDVEERTRIRLRAWMVR